MTSQQTEENEQLISNESDGIISPHEMMGFFFLKNTSITLFVPGTSNEIAEENPSSCRPPLKTAQTEAEEELYLNDHQQVLPLGKWIDVTHQQPTTESGLSDTKRQKVSHSCTTEASSFFDKSPDDGKCHSKLNGRKISGAISCPRCNLVLNLGHKLEMDRSEGGLTFTGFVEDMKCCPNHYCSRSADSKEGMENYQRENRSDAALLLGTLLNCSAEGYIRIENFQIFATEQEKVSTEEECEIDDESIKIGSSTKKNDVTGSYYCQVRASIVITVSLPHLERISSDLLSQNNQQDNPNANQVEVQTAIVQRRSEISPTQRSKRKRQAPTNNCVLPAYAQLVFSLIRSDWSQLDQDMIFQEKLFEKIKRSGNNYETLERRKGIEEKSLFPSSLTLEELYLRIQGATSKDSVILRHERIMPTLKNNGVISPDKNQTANRQSADDDDDDSTANFFAIPEVVVQSVLAPYLRAKSLNNLRNTCKFLHQTLQAVVPGMKLRLFNHQVRSLRWMRGRESTKQTEADALQLNADCPSASASYGDLYRSVTAGSIVKLKSRRFVKKGQGPRKRMNKKDFYWLVDSVSGDASPHTSGLFSITVARTKCIARGGLLCDDPGLGKTITVLSLILQTFGQTTEKHQDDASNQNTSSHGTPVCTEETIFKEYWKEGTTPQLRIPDIQKMIKEVKGLDKNCYFDDPNSHLWEGHENAITKPIWINEIAIKNKKDSYKENFQTFCGDVELCYENAMAFHPSGSSIHELAKANLEHFKSIVHDFKLYQLKQAEKSLSRTRNRSDTSFGALLKVRKQNTLKDSLHPSKGTLLVVPNTLLKHWEDQIKRHVDFSVYTHRRPLLYRNCGRRSTGIKVSQFFDEVYDIHKVKSLCNIKNTHCPILFIDEKSNIDLPPPKILNMFHIVITSSQRLTSEWKNGSFEEEIRMRKNEDDRFSARKRVKSYKQYNYDNNNSTIACPLLKVHWLRLVVDEGHVMGRGSHSNSIQFASWITAQRRWAMTGTPTPQTVARNGIKNLFGLMKFLNHDYFALEHEGDEKCKELASAFNEGNLSVFFKLRSLLNLFMVRHTKHHIEDLPKPEFVRTYLEMSNDETLAYNTLVSAVQMNLVPTSMESKTSGFQDSLLNSSQSRYAQRALNNIRLACSGGTKVCPTLTQQNFDLTMDLMRNKHNANEIQLTVVRNFLHRMTTEQLSSCMVCGFGLQTLFLLPCACQICTECLHSRTKACPACDKPFDADEFQLLQPGLDYNWKWNIEEAEKTRREAELRRRVENLNAGDVPRQRAPIAAMDDLEDPQEQIAQNGLHVMERNEAQLPPRPGPFPNRMRNRKHQCIYPDIYTDGKCTICEEKHASCHFMNDKSQCPICHCEAEDCPKEESKAYYVTNKLLKLYSDCQNGALFPPYLLEDININNNCQDDNQLKVIIFSQFRQILNVVGDRLIRRFGQLCVAEYWGTTKQQELETFSKSSDCFCMLLGKDGSHGLDLSFVTHIFFLDEILDKSLESQVVARAYRMGAKFRVRVEQLVSLNSVEELIIQINKSSAATNNLYAQQESNDVDNAPKKERQDHERKFDEEEINEIQNSPKKNNNLAGVTKAQQQAKMHFLLSNVKLIRPANVIRKKFGFSQSKQCSVRTSSTATTTSLSDDDDDERSMVTARPATVRPRVKFAL